MDEPLAFFMTWTTYGTWLPGDERGWVSKPGSVNEPSTGLKAYAKNLMTEPEWILDAEQRQLVERTIADHCQIRNWHLHAVNCRTNHIHLVVTAPGRKPEEVMNQLKAWCTRRLKELERARNGGNCVHRQNWWTQRGSKRFLNDHASLEKAILYVLECQGDGTIAVAQSPPRVTPHKPEAPAKGKGQCCDAKPIVTPAQA